MGNFFSTSSTPRLYKGIKLLLADPEKDFPEEFNPERPFKVRRMENTSRESFVKTVERLDGAFVVPQEKFVPSEDLIDEAAPEVVELRDGATYIVVPREWKAVEKRVSSFAAFCSVVDFKSIIADLILAAKFHPCVHLFLFDFAV
jgi:hypothetical protein